MLIIDGELIVSFISESNEGEVKWDTQDYE